MNRSKNGYAANIEDETENNDNYRKVLYTGSHMQLVVMSLKPGEEIGEEVHDGHDQFFRVEVGQAKVTIDDEEIDLVDDEVAIVPSGAKHNVVNTGDTDLKLYTIYAPAEHEDGTVQKEKR